MTGTGFDVWNDAGATGWLATSAPIAGGEVFSIRWAIWDDGSAVFEWEGGPMHELRVLACDLPFCGCDDSMSVTGGSDPSWHLFQHLAHPADPPVVAPPVLYGDPGKELGLHVGIGPFPLQSNKTYAVIPYSYSVCDLPEGDCFVDQTGCAIFHMP